jgi:hypothetical protein
VGEFLCVNSSYDIKITMYKFVENGKYIFVGCRYNQNDFAEGINNIFYVSINKLIINYLNFFDDLRLCHIKDKESFSPFKCLHGRHVAYELHVVRAGKRKIYVKILESF